MKKTLTTLFTLLLVMAITACASEKIKHPGKTVTHNYNCTGFTAIDCNAPVTIHYTQANTYAVRLVTNTDWQPKITVKGKTLHIESPASNISLPSDNATDLYISSPDLYSVSLSSATDFQTAKIKSDRLKLTTSGATSITAGDLDCGTFILDTHGAADLTVGKLAATTANITTSGASDITVTSAHCNTLKGNIAGAGDLILKTVTAGLLDLQSSGSSDVTANASAKTVNISASGASTHKLQIKADKANIALTGSGDANLAYQGGTLNLSTAGSSDVEASVTCTTVNATCYGASDITLKGTAKNLTTNGQKDNIDTSKLRRN